MGAPERTAGTIPAPRDDHKAAFFRHGGWLMITSVASGMFSLGVHFLSKRVDVADWGTFGALLAVLTCIPAIPLQMVLAQQTAAALATGRERQLAGMIRLAWAGTLGVCLVGGVFLWFAQDQLMARWEMDTATPLWITLVAALFTFWMPMFFGIMQGQQNFLWLGWGMILNGAGRVVCAALVVLLVGGSVAGLMTGVLLGLSTAVGLGIWQTRRLWSGPAAAFDRRALLKQVLPLMVGFGASQFLFSGDVMFVKSYFEQNEATFYVAAGTLSRALVWFVGPLAAVMFPKIVHSTARAEKTNLMGLTLACTAVLAALGAAGLWIVGPHVVKLVYKPEYVLPTTSLIPWYAAAMLPFCLANVLVNNLLAKSDFRPVPVMVALAVAYGVTLTLVHGSLVTVLQMVGLFNLALLVVCAWFTWGVKPRPFPTTAPMP